MRGVLLSKNSDFFSNCGLKLLQIMSRWQPYSEASRILAFSSFKDEVDTSPIIDHAMASDKEVYLPETNSDFTMNFYCNGKAFSQPCTTDLSLVPGLAFNRQGQRLGRGKGCYDRFLPHCREAVICGICCDLQIIENIPTEIQDETVDFIITEHEIIPCSSFL